RVQAACLTFDPDPEVILHPERSFRSLCTLAERVERLRALGLERVDVVPFTAELAQRSAEEFVAWLQDRYALGSLWVGSDFALGRNRTGTIDQLRTLASQAGFEIVPVELLCEGERPVSSTWIREC